MNKKENGGPAFPFEYHNQTARCQPSFTGEHMISPGGAETYGGMTLRDYFAAKVFAAAVSAVGGKEFDEAKFAKTAYVCADALIAERAQ